MIEQTQKLKANCRLKDPLGRIFKVADIFVPKNHPEKADQLPSSFRYLGRKVVVFESGGIMHMNDIKRRYSLVS